MPVLVVETLKAHVDNFSIELDQYATFHA